MVFFYTFVVRYFFRIVSVKWERESKYEIYIKSTLKNVRDNMGEYIALLQILFFSRDDNDFNEWLSE